MTIEDNFFSAFVGIDDIVIDGSSIGHADDEDLVTLSDGNVIVSGNMEVNNVIASGTITASDITGSFSGDGTGLTGVSATEVGVLAGQFPIEFEGATADPYETKLSIIDPTQDREITIPDVSGTLLTTGNKTDIDSVGIITGGTWNASVIQNPYIAENLRITEGIINNTVIGSVTPNEGGFTNVTASGAVTGGSITDGTATIDDGAVTGVTTITGSGLATVGSLDVDDVLVAVSYTHLTLPTIYSV